MRIFIIEDNEDHARILQWSFEQSGRKDQLKFFTDPEDALVYLARIEEQSVLLPDLILLDLNLPKIDGIEVLRRIRSQEATRNIPVVVVSSSEREEDVVNAYRLGANTFVSKSTLLDQPSTTLSVIQEYWSSVARLPSRR